MAIPHMAVLSFIPMEIWPTPIPDDKPEPTIVHPACPMALIPIAIKTANTIVNFFILIFFNYFFDNKIIKNLITPYDFMKLFMGIIIVFEKSNYNSKLSLIIIENKSGLKLIK
jgi:uncharacterized membrane protein